MSVYLTNRRRDPFADISADDFLRIRKYRCEARGLHCIKLASQRHHGLVRRSRRYNKQLNVLINYQAVCHVCHTETGYADSKENHEKFEQMQRDRYGADVDTFYEMLEAAGKVL